MDTLFIPTENDFKTWICEAVKESLNVSVAQYIAISHRDTNHQHLHIVANRTGFDRRTVSDSNSYKKIANYCRKMELKYKLKQVLSPRKYLSQEQRKIPRHDQRKELLRQEIKQALSKSGNYREFEQRMKEKGYTVTKGRGISFTDEKKVKVKGSDLNYSLQTIERILQKQSMLPGTLTIKSEDRNKLHLNENISKEQKPENNIKEAIVNTMQQLMKTEGRIEQIDSHLLQKRKQKKKQHRSHHL